MLNSVTGRLQVEYYPTRTPSTGADEIDGSSTSSLLEEHNDAESPTTERSKQKRPRISDSLAALGVYSRSMKPQNDWVNQGIYPPPTVDLFMNLPARNKRTQEHPYQYFRKRSLPPTTTLGQSTHCTQPCPSPPYLSSWYTHRIQQSRSTSVLAQWFTDRVFELAEL
jgi:hypothetical protein